jgi:DNA-binding XRE family transcriptional regulator
MSSDRDLCDYRTVPALESWSEVAERVRAARTASGLTQGELANRIGIDRTAMSKVEAGERGLSVRCGCPRRYRAAATSWRSSVTSPPTI